MLDFFSKRKCIFCSKGNLTHEHIYPKWLFDHLKLDSVIFQPSSTAYLIKGSRNAEIIEQTKWSSDEREIRYEDFKTKVVCQNCNNGWMSNLERVVKPIFVELLNNQSDIKENSAKASVLSQWAIIKVILIAKSSKIKIDFDPFLFTLLKEGIIPEGFMVELSSFSNYFLNL
jgi:hypothetical protein